MKYGVIGCGNMAKALIEALSLTTKDILLANRTRSKAEALAQIYNCMVGENEEVAQKCDRIFLGVKPQQIETVLKELVPILKERKPILISMAAGISLSKIETICGSEIPIIRIMPNTPVAIGKGLILYTKNEWVKESDCQAFLKDMQGAGIFDEIDEKLMDGASSISGCGPAYMYMFLDALAEGGVRVGIPKEKALLYAAQTMLGSAEMVLKTKKHPSVLMDEVCSPGGSTICGVQALEENRLRYAGMQAVIAATEKNKDLGKK